MTPNETIALPGDRVGIIIRRRNGEVHIAVVDAEDYPLVAGYRWRTNPKGYAVSQLPIVKGSRSSIKMHRLILGVTDPRTEVDHINGTKDDNTRSNLRLATSSQNHQNTGLRAANKSGYKGVCWDKKHQKYRAYIQLNRKQYHLGLFDDPDEANRVVRENRERMHGEFVNHGEAD